MSPMLSCFINGALREKSNRFARQLASGKQGRPRRQKRLAKEFKLAHVSSVSIAEIKASIDRMTDEERFFAAAYLRHRAQEQDEGYRALLSERMKRLESGQKVDFDQVKRIHEALEAEGF